MDPVGEVAILEPLDDFSSSSDSEMILTKSSRSSFYYSYLRKEYIYSVVKSIYRATSGSRNAK